MLLTLLMNLSMFGEPPIRPDSILINVGCPIETSFEVSSAVTTDAVVSCEFEAGIVTRSKVSKTATIDSSITRRV